MILIHKNLFFPFWEKRNVKKRMVCDMKQFWLNSMRQTMVLFAFLTFLSISATAAEAEKNSSQTAPQKEEKKSSALVYRTPYTDDEDTDEPMDDEDMNNPDDNYNNPNNPQGTCPYGNCPKGNCPNTPSNNRPPR
jgi:hypothetical protein